LTKIWIPIINATLLRLLITISTFIGNQRVGMLRTTSLRFSYNKQTGFHFPNIELASGEKLLILGPSGSGKTTLLHLISGLLRPTEGSVELDGTLVHKLSVSKLDRFRGRNIGLVFQRPNFIQALSLEENLNLVQYLSGKRKNNNRVREVAAGLGIEHKLRANPNMMSQGERQRAAIALAVINSPQLILADEPTSSLDDINCWKVTNLLKQQATATMAQLIIVTHDQRLKEQFQKTVTL
jgi:putative ABC transport system ATP-binding protein